LKSRAFQPKLQMLVAVSAIAASPPVTAYANPSTIRKSRSAALPNTFSAA
jgi:hypothetical protein